jgi:hypothetical protein
MFDMRLICNEQDKSQMLSDTAITIHKLNKIYDNGFIALEDINLEIKRGEIFALLWHIKLSNATYMIYNDELLWSKVCHNIYKNQKEYKYKHY